jgi:hypothetical protein
VVVVVVSGLGVICWFGFSCICVFICLHDLVT